MGSGTMAVTPGRISTAIQSEAPGFADVGFAAAEAADGDPGTAAPAADAGFALTTPVGDTVACIALEAIDGEVSPGGRPVDAEPGVREESALSRWPLAERRDGEWPPAASSKCGSGCKSDTIVLWCI